MNARLPTPLAKMLICNKFRLLGTPCAFGGFKEGLPPPATTTAEEHRQLPLPSLPPLHLILQVKQASNTELYSQSPLSSAYLYRVYEHICVRVYMSVGAHVCASVHASLCSHMWSQRLTCVIDHSPHFILRQGESSELVAQ